MPLLCVSACLLGHEVRYDGGQKLQRRILRLPNRYALLAACPEAECGLGIPREQMRLEGKADNPRIVGIISGHDFTPPLKAWCKHYMKTTGTVDGFILKGRSPSCGIKSEVTVKGGSQFAPGVFASTIFKTHPLAPIIDEGQFNNEASREGFLHRAELLSEWRLWGRRDIKRFHERHLALAIAHNPRVGASLNDKLADKSAYIAAFMRCLDYCITEAKMTRAISTMNRCGCDTDQSLCDPKYRSRFTKPSK